MPKMMLYNGKFSMTALYDHFVLHSSVAKFPGIQLLCVSWLLAYNSLYPVLVLSCDCIANVIFCELKSFLIV
jgi:hypothetical protein